MSKTVCVFSGGADSTTLLHYIKHLNVYDDIYAITYFYGQRHSKEIECAKYQSQIVGVKEHKIIDISFLGQMLEGSALTDLSIKVPGAESIGDPQPASYVFNRNMILLSIAIGYAEAIGADTVYYGAQKQDMYGYFDSTPEFVDRLNNVLNLNRKNRITIETPFVRMKKTEVLEIGCSLDVDYSKTWTCYLGEEKACGKCLTCMERLKSFQDLNLQDPLEYEKD